MLKNPAHQKIGLCGMWIPLTTGSPDDFVVKILCSTQLSLGVGLTPFGTGSALNSRNPMTHINSWFRVRRYLP
jgi:hypothetical protein